jgi:hypothetical protein
MAEPIVALTASTGRIVVVPEALAEGVAMDLGRTGRAPARISSLTPCVGRQVHAAPAARHGVPSGAAWIGDMRPSRPAHTDARERICTHVISSHHTLIGGVARSIRFIVLRNDAWIYRERSHVAATIVDVLPSLIPPSVRLVGRFHESVVAVLLKEVQVAEYGA